MQSGNLSVKYALISSKVAVKGRFRIKTNIGAVEVSIVCSSGTLEALLSVNRGEVDGRWERDWDGIASGPLCLFLGFSDWVSGWESVDLIVDFRELFVDFGWILFPSSPSGAKVEGSPRSGVEFVIADKSGCWIEWSFKE